MLISEASGLKQTCDGPGLQQQPTRGSNKQSSSLQGALTNRAAAYKGL
uniref:Uncharacterized protein n=1 Tax=Anguilla anguilla TaxID=7936 RepID=A0A0E9P9Y3_ANGAN